MLSGLSSAIISKKPFLNPETCICFCFVPLWNSCLFVSWWLITSSSVGSYLYVCSQGFQPFLVPNEHPENRLHRLLLWSNLNPQTFSLSVSYQNLHITEMDFRVQSLRFSRSRNWGPGKWHKLPEFMWLIGDLANTDLRSPDSKSVAVSFTLWGASCISTPSASGCC